MSSQDQINKIRRFIGWFEDNFADEEYLINEEGEDGIIAERWISYLDHPEYLGACDALDSLQKDLTNG